MKYIIMCLLLTSCAGIKEKPKFELISDQDLLQGNGRYGNVIVELKEFKIGKKHCLWGSKNFDDKCQDAGMEYAYGDKWREFKKVALDFVEYIKEKNAKNLISLFGWEYNKYGIFSIYVLDKNKKGRYLPGLERSMGHLRLLYVKKLWKDKYYGFTKKEIERAKYIIEITKQKPFFLNDPMEILEKYLNNTMQDLSEAINGREYKDFLLKTMYGAYIINISEDMTIDFVECDADSDNIHTESYSIPKIDRIEYYN